MYMASRLALHRLDVRSIFKIKMRDFIVKHKTDLKLKLYEEVTPGRESAGPRQGRVVSLQHDELVKREGYDNLYRSTNQCYVSR